MSKKIDGRKFNKGRQIKVSKEDQETRLNADNGLMREKLKYLGYNGLFTLITKKRLGKRDIQEMTNSLLALRNMYLVYGYPDLRFVGNENGTDYRDRGDGYMLLPSRRNGNLGKHLVNDAPRNDD